MAEVEGWLGKHHGSRRTAVARERPRTRKGRFSKRGRYHATGRRRKLRRRPRRRR